MASYYAGTGGNDSTGDGLSHATRWLTAQKALDTMTTGQPNRLNLTGSETLAASLDFTTYGVPSNRSNFLIFNGYTNAEGDGGVFGFNGGGNRIISNASLNYVFFRSLKVTNWGATEGFLLDNFCGFQECELDGEGARTAWINADAGLNVRNCKLHSIALSGFAGIRTDFSSFVIGNYLHVVSAAANSAVVYGATNSECRGNTISIKSSNAVRAIWLSDDGSRAESNTVFNQTQGNGLGIVVTSSSTELCVITNNIISGFSVGVQVPSGPSLAQYGHNKFYNNTTDESVSSTVIFDLGNNSSLGSNPFTSTGNADHNDDDWTVDTTVKAAGYPSGLYDPDGTFGDRNLNYLDCGAMQREEPVGGSTVITKTTRIF